jgi:hypothetical protein
VGGPAGFWIYAKIFGSLALFHLKIPLGGSLSDENAKTGFIDRNIFLRTRFKLNLNITNKINKKMDYRDLVSDKKDE